jgi:hypothetical protein
MMPPIRPLMPVMRTRVRVIREVSPSPGLGEAVRNALAERDVKAMHEAMASHYLTDLSQMGAPSGLGCDSSG